MKIAKQRKKPNCKQGNIACGKRCQPKHYKCPSEKGEEVSEASDKFVNNIMADNTAVVPAASTAAAVVTTITPSPLSVGKSKLSAEEFYNSSLALFSKESKAERRAKIKGLSNEKELKKIQLREENEAWIFVRLKRELDRLEKKGGEAEDIAKLKNLLSKIIDGDGEAKAEGKERVEGKIKVGEEKEEEKETVKKIEAVIETIEVAAVSPAVPPQVSQELAPTKTQTSTQISTPTPTPTVAVTQAATKAKAKAGTSSVAVAKSAIIKDEAAEVEEINGKAAESASKAKAETSAKAEGLIGGNEERIRLLRERANELNIELLDENDTENIAEKIKVAVEKTLEKLKSEGWDSSEGIPNLAKDTYELLLKFDFSNRSPENIREILVFANERILVGADSYNSYRKPSIPSAERTEKADEAMEYLYRLQYKLQGDSVEKIKAVGDESLRGKKDIPPLPEKFSESESESLNETFRNFLEEADVVVQVSPEALKGILKSGRFKNKFEKGAVGSIGAGSKYTKARKLAEEKKFGIDYADGKASERPIYGSVELRPYGKSTHKFNQYGNIQVVMSKDVKRRSTITLGDSLNNPKAAPTPILDPRKECISGWNAKDVLHEGGPASQALCINEKKEKYKLGTVAEYIEAQIFGGISLKDIEFVRIPSPMLAEFPELLDLLTSKGVRFEIVPS